MSPQIRESEILLGFDPSVATLIGESEILLGFDPTLATLIGESEILLRVDRPLGAVYECAPTTPVGGNHL